MNVSKGRKQTHLRNEPLTFNLTGCTFPALTVWSTQLTLARDVAGMTSMRY